MFGLHSFPQDLPHLHQRIYLFRNKQGPAGPVLCAFIYSDREQAWSQQFKMLCAKIFTSSCVIPTGNPHLTDYTKPVVLFCRVFRAHILKSSLLCFHCQRKDFVNVPVMTLCTTWEGFFSWHRAALLVQLQQNKHLQQGERKSRNAALPIQTKL